ncbi:cytosolic carboxypeptidase-like protein 5 [Nymphalis io]|uniref:cytosolic carboxypeptidase-like protein 5 n=1 Tax=Inachis io TaxID=171585 RepID=UPI002168FDE0|nr:cytosolic carboxypeptidase-like protein 5 [Nymphalis io]XP_050343631.1 cytosolic carboxypeptidase-like protein 5 [Nymphalis io]
MDHNNIIECAGFYFIHNFDSGNLGHVERVPTEFITPFINPKTNAAETPDYEFNLWTRPDCAGTEFENGNRTWFYFGIQASEPNVQVRLNLINLNKQGKMYNQGMAPVTRTLPGKPQWERIRDRPVHSTDDNTFTLSFRYRTAENPKATTFFAFTYPYSFAELQIALNSIDLKMLPLPPPQSPDDIYYCRECLIYSLEGRRVDLLTISSHHGITTEREDRLKNLFPDNQERPFKFQNKKVIFVSARVHPGETPSSFVFNGFLNLLLMRNDPIAIQLRKLYVFKLIPFLNPDGVARGHYRTDTRGVNLNRVYLNPSLTFHPTVYASRSLIRYYHFGCEKEDDICEESKSFTARSVPSISESAELIETKKKRSVNSPTYKRDKIKTSNKSTGVLKQVSVDSSKDVQSLSSEAGNLAEQVYDMKLQEMPLQASDVTSNLSDTNVGDSSSLLNETVLKSCLGSNVHLSTSEELTVHGNNPLKPLRDTLKNSISLLMESTSFITDEPRGRVRAGWCAECRRAAARLERSAPGLAAALPGCPAALPGCPAALPGCPAALPGCPAALPGCPAAMRPESPTYHTIEEYGEHQRRQIDDQERKLHDAEFVDSTESIYFCTNCFKRYIITHENEEINVQESAAHASAGVSAGDHCLLPPRSPAHSTAHSPAHSPSHSPAHSPAGSTGDALVLPPLQLPTLPKEEKSKSVLNKQPKKKPLPSPVSPGPPSAPRVPYKEVDSGLYLYIDLHGHASKKGIFMYGNHFEDLDSCVECMLLPRIMSLNNLHFHFSSCNFTERNMYLKDRRDGMSREGSGRVAVLKATGLVRSYTLECNYNTGRLVNVLPPAARDPPAPHPPAPPAAPPPPKYTPHIFQEVGRSLGASILDLTGQHPNSRIPCSEHRNLSAVRDWLRAHTRTLRPQLTTSRLRPKTSSPTRLPLFARSKAKVTDERKENTFVAAKSDSERKRSPPVLAQRSGHELVNSNMKFAKKNDPVKTSSRTRYLAENEPKPKTLSTKRRNVLAIRKPNASKTQAGGVVKAKCSRRAADDADGAKLCKRSYSRTLRRRAAAATSEEDFVAPSPSRLKKIRLKAAL